MASELLGRKTRKTQINGTKRTTTSRTRKRRKLGCGLACGSPPREANSEIDVQVAESRDVCYTPENFWRPNSAEGVQAKKNENVYYCDDLRAQLLMKLIRTFYMKATCSFINPDCGRLADEEVFYFRMVRHSAARRSQWLHGGINIDTVS